MTHLIDIESKHLLRSSLVEMHSNRIQSYYNWLNILVLGSFIALVCGVLYYCNSNQLSPHEKAQKMMKEQQYILSKIREAQITQAQQQQQQSQITNLPGIQTIHEYDTTNHTSNKNNAYNTYNTSILQ